jgi:osmotically-inducible protein OsmY
MKNDREIQHDVLAALDSEHVVTAGTIGVEVHHGVVKLAGRVGDSAIKQSAETTASRVGDVTAVVMDVDVAGDASARPA